MGSDTNLISNRAQDLIQSQVKSRTVGLELRGNPFGAGDASEKIVGALLEHLSKK